MTGTKCAVRHCKNYTPNKNNIRFYRIPKSRCSSWMQALGNPPALRNLSACALNKQRICVDHFLDKDFNNANTKERLNDFATPSQNLFDKESGSIKSETIVPAVLKSTGATSSTSSAIIPATNGNCKADLNIDIMEWEHNIVDPIDSEQPLRNASPVVPPPAVPSTSASSSSLPTQEVVSPSPTENKSNVKKKVKRGVKVFPVAPRVPLKQRTPLVSSILKCARENRVNARSIWKKYYATSQELKNLKKNYMEMALKDMRKKLNPGFMKMLEVQLKNADRPDSGHRYNLDEKMLFLGIRQKGPRCYEALPMIKPSKKPLRQVVKMLNLKPGVNDIIVKGLAARVQGMPEDKRDCCVLFDEMSLKTFYSYDRKEDLITGFADLGGGDRRDLPAEDVMICMVRFIYGQAKQPIAFWYTNKKMTAQDFAKMFQEAMEALIKHGIRLRAAITDSLGKNKASFLLLGASEDSPWFFILGQKVYVIFDVPHLLKALRNALLKYPLLLPNGEIVDFKYVEAFIKKDMQMTPRIAKKVNTSHFNLTSFQKQNVAKAAQVLSGSVALGVLVYSVLGGLPHEAISTGRFIEKINNFFDSWNGIEKIENSPDNKCYKSALADGSPHQPLWDELRHEMLDWQFLGSTNLVFHKNWSISTNSALCLHEDLKQEGKDNLPVGHLNSDSLENTNSQLRLNGGHRLNPSVQDFPSSFATVLVNQLTSSVKGKNCRDENSLNLVNLEYLYDAAKAAKEREIPHEQEDDPYVLEPEVTEDFPDEETLSDEEDEEEEENNLHVVANAPDFVARLQQQMSSIAGVDVAKPIVEHHMKILSQCSECAEILLCDFQFPLHLAQTLTSAPVMQDQKFPSDVISKIIIEVFKVTAKEVPPIAYKPGVLQNLVPIIENIPIVKSFQLCVSHQATKMSLIKSVALAALKDFLRALNSDLKLKKQEKKSRKFQRVSHQ